MDNHKPEVRAILDWELSTIGHPLGDLAYACQFYYNEDVTRGNMSALGVPEEQELIDLYCELTGRTGVGHWAFTVRCKDGRGSASGESWARKGKRRKPLELSYAALHVLRGDSTSTRASKPYQYKFCVKSLK